MQTWMEDICSAFRIGISEGYSNKELRSRNNNWTSFMWEVYEKGHAVGQDILALERK